MSWSMSCENKKKTCYLNTIMSEILVRKGNKQQHETGVGFGITTSFLVGPRYENQRQVYMPNLSIAFIIFLTIRPVRFLRPGSLSILAIILRSASHLSFKSLGLGLGFMGFGNRVHDQFTDSIDLIRNGHS